MSVTDPVVRISLDDGTDTWVAVMPVYGWDASSVAIALDVVQQRFIQSIFEDRVAVERHLREAIARGIE